MNISRIFGIKDKPKDKSNVSIGEEVIIKLIKDGKVVEEKLGTGHTWQSDGCKEIAKWLTGTSSQSPRSLACNGTGGGVGTLVTATRTTSNTIAIWDGTFGTEYNISNITQIQIKDNGTVYAYKTCDAFNKPTNMAMVISYRSTISGV
jgi:hypothetical protein